MLKIKFGLFDSRVVPLPTACVGSQHCLGVGNDGGFWYGFEIGSFGSVRPQTVLGIPRYSIEFNNEPGGAEEGDFRVRFGVAGDEKIPGLDNIAAKFGTFPDIITATWSDALGYYLIDTPNIPLTQYIASELGNYIGMNSVPADFNPIEVSPDWQFIISSTGSTESRWYQLGRTIGIEAITGPHTALVAFRPFDISWLDVAVSAIFTYRPEGNGSTCNPIVARATDDKNYVGVRSFNGRIEVHEVINGVYRLLNQANLSNTPTDIRYELRIEGLKVSLHVNDGAEVYENFDDCTLLSGYVGMVDKANPALDNVSYDFQARELVTCDTEVDLCMWVESPDGNLFGFDGEAGYGNVDPTRFGGIHIFSIVADITADTIIARMGFEGISQVGTQESLVFDLVDYAGNPVVFTWDAVNFWYAVTDAAAADHMASKVDDKLGFTALFNYFDPITNSPDWDYITQGIETKFFEIDGVIGTHGASPDCALMFAPFEEWFDMEASVDMLAYSGGNQHGQFLCAVRVIDEINFIGFRTWNNLLEVYERVDGTFNDLAIVKATKAETDLKRVTLRVVGNTVTILADGVPVGDYADVTDIRGGKCGIIDGNGLAVTEWMKDFASDNINMFTNPYFKEDISGWDFVGPWGWDQFAFGAYNYEISDTDTLSQLFTLEAGITYEIDATLEEAALGGNARYLIEGVDTDIDLLTPHQFVAAGTSNAATGYIGRGDGSSSIVVIGECKLRRIG